LDVQRETRLAAIQALIPLGLKTVEEELGTFWSWWVKSTSGMGSGTAGVATMDGFISWIKR
jgi:hypothetical protein